MLKNNKINIYGCLLKLIYTPVFATKLIRNLLSDYGFFYFHFLFIMKFMQPSHDSLSAKFRIYISSLLFA